MGSGAAGSEAVGRARVHRGGAADDRPRRDHRQHCAAVGAGSPRRLRRRPAVGRHRLHTSLRPPAAADRGRPSLDVPGVVLAGAGLVSLVYGTTEAVRSGWSSATVIALLAASAVLLVLFVLREARTPSPLLPLRIVTDRNRGGAYLAVGLALAGMFGAYLFLTYDFQVVLHYTPLQADLARKLCSMVLPRRRAGARRSWSSAPWWLRS